MTDQIQNKLQSEVDIYKEIQKDYHKAVTQRQHLDGQLNENAAVKQELDLLKPEAEVYKLIGPVLIKQDLEESKQNVVKRMNYIRSELKRVDDLIASLDKKQDSQRDTLNKLQQKFQEMHLKSAPNKS